MFNHHRYLDDRGYFSPLYTGNEMDGLMRGSYRQVNLAESKFGVLRGLHRQDQTKLVTPIKGQIFDVAVDVDSGKWFGCYLDSTMALFIPPQYAHGYLVLSDDALVQYVVDQQYKAGEEETFPWNGYGIDWPLNIIPQLSSKDKNVAQESRRRAA